MTVRSARWTPVLFLAGLLSCTEGAAPTGPGNPAAGLRLIPSFPQFASVSGEGLQFDTRSIDRVRIVARDTAGRILADTTVTATPADTAGWKVGLTFELPSRKAVLPVRITADLMHLEAGASTVQWNGVTDLVHIRGDGGGPRDVPVRLRLGAPSDTAITAVTILAPPAALVEGDTVQLEAQAEGAPTTSSGIFWAVLDPDIASVAGGRVRTVRDGTVRVVAAAGLRQDTVTLRVGRRPAAVHLAASLDSLFAIGEVTTLTARVDDPRGAVMQGVPVSWQSTGDALVHTGNGVFRAVANGQATIHAAVTGRPGVSATRTVVVRQRAALLSIAPGAVTLTGPGSSAALTVEARDPAGHPVPHVVPAWTSANAAVATVSAQGVVTAAAPGSTEVIARVDGVEARVPITVARVAASVSVSPAETVLTSIGATAPLSAVVRSSDGTPMPGTVQWHSDAPAVASVAADGVVTAHGAGDATITARHGTLAGTASIRVAPVVGHLVVEPSSLQMALGSTVTLSVDARDAHGNPIDAALTWWTSDASVAAVDGNGTVTGAGAGTAVITVRSGDVAAEVPVVVRQDAVAASLVAVAGDGQQGVVAEPLPQNLVVEARNAAGEPVPDVLVRWRVPGAAADPATGQFTTDSAWTDAHGRATTGWMLGQKAGPQVSHAVIAGTPLRAEFRAHARAGQAHGVRRNRGGLEAVVTPGLVDMMEIQVSDQYDNPVADQEVRWAIIGGGPHSVLPNGSQVEITRTDSAGVTSLEWAGFSTQMGVHRLRISIDGTPVELVIEKRTRAARLHRLNLQPRNVQMRAFRDTVFDVSPQDEYGNAVEGVSFTWSSDRPDIMDASSLAPGRGRGQGRGNGVARITVSGATADTTVTDSASVEVAQEASSGITVSGPASVPNGGAVQLTAAGSDDRGNPIRQFRWSVLPASPGFNGQARITAGERDEVVTVQGQANGRVKIRVSDPSGSVWHEVELMVSSGG